MAYGTLSAWSKNVEWDQVVEGQFESIVFRNLTGVMSIIPQVEQGGGSAHEWRVNVTGNTSTEVFTEGGAQPTPVAQRYVMATLSPAYFRNTVRITGHVRDAIKGKGLPEQFDVIRQEFSLGFEDIRDLMETTFQGTGNNGLQLALDSAGTYANINRSTYSDWGSYENALSGALTIAAIANAREAIRDNDRGGAMDLILGPHNQLTNLHALTPVGPLPRLDSPFNSPAAQMAYSEKGAMFGDAAFYPLGDLTNTVLLYLERRLLSYVNFRSFEIYQHDRTGDDDVWQVSTAGTIKYANSQKGGKETGVTA